MSSVVKQLLGTETAKSLRAKGSDTIICGLSANDVEKSFLKAGANFFVIKPLPTDRIELTRVLFRILDSAGNHFNRGVPNRPEKLLGFSKLGTVKRRVAQHEDDTSDLLPKTFSVLFVDDDDKLRNLFSRSLKRAMPEWTIQQAPDGETALELTNMQRYDLIFLDQYMPSKDKIKPLLGTETAYALRAKGVTSLICGLSANDAKAAFMEAGANYFHMKPFPHKKDDIIRELILILSCHDKYTNPLETLVESPASDPLTPVSNDSLGDDATKPSNETEYSPSVLKTQREVDEEKLGNFADANPLPENLSVLYVDDSKSLRKLFSRSLERATKGWKVCEAESGKAALELVESVQFDLIFLDQHLEGSDLGTDIAKALRDRGVTSIICGLSADNIETTFKDAGASFFLMKPLPCEKNELTKQLNRILSCAPSPNATTAKTT